MVRGLVLLLTLALSLPAWAQDANKGGWTAPFGGWFNADVTVASDYSYAVISNTGRSPAFQMGLDWHSPYLLAPSSPPLWFYLTAWGSNVWFPSSGEGIEIDL